MTELIIYQSEDGRSRLEIRFDGETLWLSSGDNAQSLSSGHQPTRLSALLLSRGSASLSGGSGELGLSLRQDRVHVGLYDSVARRITATVREDEVQETLAGLYAQTALELGARWRALLGLRADHVDNRVDALSLAANGGRSSATQLSPKLSLIARPWDKTELFFNAGRSFHSNDARGSTISVDPVSGEPVSRVDPLVRSSDPYFRPVDLDFAPDGSLYLLDWYNPLIGHMQHSLRQAAHPGPGDFGEFDITITATTPAHAAGAVVVAVTAPGGNVSLPSGFTYAPPVPTIGTVAPNTGSTLGGTSVTITGSGFTGAGEVRLASKAGLKLTEAVALEKTPDHYLNVVAVKTEDKDKPWARDIASAFHTPEYRTALDKHFAGYARPSFLQ